ncbi:MULTISPECIES: hypothetical protein [Acinetobacter]|uniref:hypothetical protein n=1 Tax=Acinetobacter TaxID=469 RepID=UPI0013EEC20F|nr:MULTISPECIES: hypothetical protein [Acinetobacter]
MAVLSRACRIKQPREYKQAFKTARCDEEAGTAECWVLMILSHYYEMFFIKR